MITRVRGLTPSEERAVEELKVGGSIKEISVRLGISPNTLKERLKSVYAKLEVHSARELLLKLYLQPQPGRRNAQVSALAAILDAPSPRFILSALAEAAAAQLDVRAEVMTINELHPPRSGGFLGVALAKGEARSDYGVAELPGWPPPVIAIRLLWPAGRALLVVSDPRRLFPADARRQAILLARFTEAVLAQHCLARVSG